MVFLGDIAFYMAVLVFATGVFMVHHACHHDAGKQCRLLKFGGYIVVVISLLGMLCTGYYWLKYYSQGAYEKNHRQHHAMMMGKGMQHCMGQMEGKMMDPNMMMKMKSCMMQKGMKPMDPNSEEMSKEEHDSHH